MKWLQIKKRTLWCFLITIPFFEPQFFKTINIIDNIYKYAVYVALIYAIIQMIRLKMKPSINLALIFALEFWIIFTTVIHGGNVNSAMNFAILLFALSCVVFVYSKSIDKLIRCLLLHFELCIYINIITLLLFKNGLYWIDSGVYSHGSAGYFLGWNHIFIVWELPALLIAWLYKSMFDKNIRCYCLTVAILFCELFFGASTGKVGVIIFVLLCIIPFLKQIITPIRGMILVLAFGTFIIFIRSYDFLKPIIVGLLNEDMTFTGRLLVWDNAIKEIISKPLLGHGVLPQKEVSSMLGFGAATHCHNEILQVAFIGGIVALGFFIALYIFCLNKAIHLWSYRAVQASTYAIITYTLIGITEQYEYALMYLILIIPFYLKQICGYEEMTRRIKQKRGIINGKV